jgi:hypothetical protein
MIVRYHSMINGNSFTPRVNAYLVCAPEVELAEQGLSR